MSTLYDDRPHASRRQIDFRVSTLPGPHGEDAVIRVLDPTMFKLDLDELGITAEVLARYRRLISYPSGLILSAGPTVSGKTNTLYATVAALRERGLKIVTVEDPIEYTFPKVNQKAVTGDMDFADTVRAFLRQNPDLILVGEIRDAETAQVVFQAATTGHLVLSTIHARSSVSAIARLRSLGISDDSISHSLVAVLGQRLVAMVCPMCREDHSPRAELLQRFYGDTPSEASFVRGAGCDTCSDRGYRGLTGVFELLELDRTLTRAISQHVPVTDLEEIARGLPGYTHMLADALTKAERGETTLEEVARRIAPDLIDA